MEITRVDSAWTVIVHVLHATDHERMSVQPVKAGNIYSPPVVVLPPALTVCEIECIFIVIKKKKN